MKNMETHPQTYHTEGNYQKYNNIFINKFSSQLLCFSFHKNKNRSVDRLFKLVECD